MEKHLIPTVVSIAVTLFVFFLTPDTSPILIKLGEVLYIVFVFCLTFIAIQLMIFIVRRLARAVERVQDNSVVEEKNKQILEKLWSIVDRFNPYDFNCLMEFITNNNSPIEKTGEFFGEGLFNSNFVYSTSVKKAEKSSTVYSNEFPSSSMFISETRQYKLKDDIYNALKYSYEKYGRIK